MSNQIEATKESAVTDVKTTAAEEVKKAPEAADTPTEETKVSDKGKKVDRNKAVPRPQHNVIIVRRTLPFRPLLAITKNLLKDKFDSVELHGVDQESFVTIMIASNVLTKYGYCTLTRIKTKTHQAKTAEDDARVILRPKLVVHLSKTPEFDQIQHDFEEKMTKAQEEAKEDLHAVEVSVIHNRSGDKDLAIKADGEASDGAELSQKEGGSLDNTLEAFTA